MPKLPPFTVSVDELPGHILFVPIVIDEGAVELVFTVNVALAHDVVLQSPSART